MRRASAHVSTHPGRNGSCDRLATGYSRPRFSTSPCRTAQSDTLPHAAHRGRFGWGCPYRCYPWFARHAWVGFFQRQASGGRHTRRDCARAPANTDSADPVRTDCCHGRNASSDPKSIAFAESLTLAYTDAGTDAGTDAATPIQPFLRGNDQGCSLSAERRYRCARRCRHPGRHTPDVRPNHHGCCDALVSHRRPTVLGAFARG
jgi:hypothetical protein